MLYHLIEYLERLYQPTGFQVIQFITVRAALAAITAMTLSLIAGRHIIIWLAKQQLGEQVRKGTAAGFINHAHKRGTPTMGGVIMLMAILTATLLWADLTEAYVWVIVLATAWMGAFGFADDYIKVVRLDKSGLPAKIKLAGQISLGLAVGCVLYFLPQFQEYNAITSLPFVTDGRLNYDFLSDLFDGETDLGWLVYVPVSVFIITAVSNAVNLTDGLDGLAAGTTGIVALGLVVLCYISGNRIFSDFLNEMYLPGSGELTIFAAALAAACFGFLWYNGYPASVFMGDTGSLALGAAVGTLTLMVKKELLVPLLCSVFFMETISVILQTSWFKYTRKKTGEGKRIFRMAPLHHHYEVMGSHEAKIVVRFWIVTAVSVIATLLTLRIR